MLKTADWERGNRVKDDDVSRFNEIINRWLILETD